jgi:hypothetical protein
MTRSIEAVSGTAREQRSSRMTHYLLAVHGPTDRGEFGSYGSQE